MNKVWNYENVNKVDAVNLAAQLNTSTLMSKVLLSRGFTDIQAIKDFVNDDECSHDPFLLNDMELATERINRAIDEEENITVYGDYDADGITSTTVLMKFLKSQGATVDYYIPDRIKEGYGISEEAVETILERGTELVISVDCGITAIKEAELIYDLGADFIVTDHHECSEILPNAIAIINPKRPDSTYPYSELAGVGVTYKLIQALCIKRGLGDLYKSYLDLVAIGTIADIVPLTGENRSIVKLGLKAINNSDNEGLRQLISIAGLDKNGRELSATNVAFGIAPRINAGGRMGRPELALELFFTEDPNDAKRLAVELNENNKLRQSIEQETANKIMDELNADKDIDKKRVIVVAKENLHSGIVGIVASRVLDRYYKPCIILSIEEDENGHAMAKGSCRSVEGYNIYEMLSRCQELLVQFGGHELAAGLSIKPENIKSFDEKINQISCEIDEDVFVPRINADTSIDVDEINVESIESLRALEPYGQNNPEPTFVVEGIKLVYSKTVGSNGNHMRLIFQEGDLKYDAIAFNVSDSRIFLSLNDLYDIIFTLEINEWNNNRKPSLVLIDMKRSNYGRINNKVGNDLYTRLNDVINYGKSIINEGTNDTFLNKLNERINNVLDVDFSSNNVEEIIQCIASRDDMIQVYKYLNITKKISVNHISNVGSKISLNYFKIKTSLETFIDLNLAKTDGTYIYINNNKGKKVDLENSQTYKIISILNDYALKRK